MKLLGLTGGIGTGKSTVTQMFRELGARIIDADEIAREVVKSGRPAYKEIIRRFGKEILLPDGQIDREKLGSAVFSDEEKRQSLNNITHPRVLEEMQRQIRGYMDEGVMVTLCDIPLLFESGARNWLKPVILVYADPATQLARLIKRDRCSRERALARISSQMSIDEKKKLADIVIDNSDSEDATRAQVESVWKKLTEEITG